MRCAQAGGFLARSFLMRIVSAAEAVSGSTPLPDSGGCLWKSL
mgnify:CR=1 FL=1